MFVVVFFTFVAILLTYMESHGRLKNGMFIGFVLVTLLGCVHYNYGSDYMEYLNRYRVITNMPLRWDYLMDDEYVCEPGWVILNHLFSHLGGFFMMVAVLNIFQNAIYYCFIKENVQKKHWALAEMIYLMNTSLYILNFSMMRQGLSISLFVLAWTFLKRKKIFPALLIIGVASTIHYSAQILFPFVLIPLIPLNKKVISCVYVGLVITLYLSSNLLSSIFETISAMEELQSAQTLEYYERNKTETVTFGLGFIINLMPFAISMWGFFTKDKMINNEKKMLIALSMVNYIITPFSQIIPILERFGMYFTAYSVAAIPFVYSLLSDKKVYRILMGIYYIMLFYGYSVFFQSEIYGRAYSTFHTVFEVL